MDGTRSAAWRGRTTIATCAIAALATMSGTLAQDRRAESTVERIRASGHLRLGYRTDARPLSYQSGSGQAAGYSVALCQKVADEVKGELHLPSLAVEWVPVPLDERFPALASGHVDLLCGADTVTLGRRREVAFSIPVFPGGIGAVIRADAAVRLREVLAGRGQILRPNWRATAGTILQSRAFTAVAGTTAETWLAERMNELDVIAKVASVKGYDEGIRGLLDRKADVFFGERAILMDAATRSPSTRDLTIVNRLFTYEPLAFALRRGDDDFRLIVDRALSRIYSSGEIGALYTSTFGEPDESAVTFFRWNVVPD